MKSKIFIKTLLTLLLLAIFYSGGLAQEDGAPAPAGQTEDAQTIPNSAPLGEDERLPFMQKNQVVQMEEPGSMGLLIKTLGAMLIIIGILFFGAWGVKKLGLGGLRSGLPEDSFNLKVLSTVTVAGGQTLAVVRFGEKILLVGATPQSFTLLADQVDVEAVQLDVPRRPQSVSDLLTEETDRALITFPEQLARAGRRLGIDLTRGGN